MKKKIKSIVALFLALAFMLTATPLSGFATEVTENTDNSETTVTQPEETEQVKEYTITYYSNGEKYGDIQTYKAGETIVPPEAPQAAEGHIFNGWVINKEQDKLPETMPETNLEASASWSLKEVAVTFISDETEIKKATVPYASSMIETVPADPAKEGFVFAGWFDKNGKNVHDYETVPSEDIEFTAKWLKNGNVTYMASKDKTYAAYVVTEGDKIPVPEKNPEKFAHKFKGWSPEIPETMPAENLVFEAQYEVDKEFVTVVIGGIAIAGGVIGLTSAAITGLSIIGGIIAVIGLSSIIGNVSKTYKAIYKVDGKVYATYNIEAGKKITVPSDPEKEGYDFTGWNPEVPVKMPENDITFEAKWSAKDTEIPETGSSAAGLAAFAALAVSAAAIVLIKKKKDK